ncbi:MAG: hydrogenase maturation nickel metallochaperone HypA [Calditrichaeota bacterium]|nr:hydrogenase maturation nickel metallochaperone HypA [Calditrichota bacterium]
MHEMSVAQSIVQIVEEVLQEQKAHRVLKVVVRIGELVAVVPESLQFCYRAITEGTELGDSELVIQTVPVRAVCQACGREFSPETPFFICPFCESTRVHLLQGQELQVSELEVEE